LASLNGKRSIDEIKTVSKDNDSDHKESVIVVLSGYALGHLKANMVHSRD
jgi:hypothetical protein